MKLKAELLEQRYDENGNLLYEEWSDGYKEINTYNEEGILIKSDITYSNGIREVEHFSGKR